MDTTSLIKQISTTTGTQPPPLLGPLEKALFEDWIRRTDLSIGWTARQEEVKPTIKNRDDDQSDRLGDS